MRWRGGVGRRVGQTFLGLPLDPGLPAAHGHHSGLDIGLKRLAKPVVRKAAANRHRDDNRGGGISGARDGNPGGFTKPYREAIGPDPLPNGMGDRRSPCVGGWANGTRRSSHVPSSCHGSFHQRKTPFSGSLSNCVPRTFASCRAASIEVLAVLSNHRAPAADRKPKRCLETSPGRVPRGSLDHTQSTLSSAILTFCGQRNPTSGLILKQSTCASSPYLRDENRNDASMADGGVDLLGRHGLPQCDGAGG